MDTTPYVTLANTSEPHSGGAGYLLNYTLPNSLWISPDLQGSDPYLSVSSDVDFASELFDITEWNATVSSLTALSWVGDLGSPYHSSGSAIAVSCLIYACLKNYYANVDTGELKETVVSVAAAPAVKLDGTPANRLQMYNGGGNYTAIKEPCRLDGQFYDKSNFSSIGYGNHSFETFNLPGATTSVPFECIYKMNGLMGWAMQTYANDTLLAGQCQYSYGRPGSFSCGDQWWLTPLYANTSATFDSISQIMYVLAVYSVTLFRGCLLISHTGD